MHSRQSQSIDFLFWSLDSLFSSSSRRHRLQQRRTRLIAQPALHVRADAATVARVRLPEVLADPLLDVADFREGVHGRLLARVELREADAEARVVDVLSVGNHVVARVCDGRVEQLFEQRLACQGPTLLVALDERLAVGERLGEGDNGRLAFEWPCQFLRLGEDDLCVDGAEDAVRKEISNAKSKATIANLLVLHRIGDTDEKVAAKAFVIASGNVVVEAHKAELEALGGVVGRKLGKQ